MNAVSLAVVIELPTLLALVIDAPRLRVEVMFVRDGCLSVTRMVLLEMPVTVAMPALIPSPDARVIVLLEPVDVPFDVPTVLCVERATPETADVPVELPTVALSASAVAAAVDVPALVPAA